MTPARPRAARTRASSPTLALDPLEPRRLLTAAVSAGLPNLYHVTAELSQPRQYFAAASLNHQLLFAGGLVRGNLPSDVVDVYHADTGQWSTARLSQPRAWVLHETVGNKIVFLGGSTSSPFNRDVPTSTAIDVYDTVTGHWSSTTLAYPADSAAIAVVGDKLVLAGGSLDASGATRLADTVVYDATTDTWSAGPPLSAARRNIAQAVVGHTLILAGGTLTGGAPADAVDLYDADTNTWSTARLSQARKDITVAVVDRKAVFAGGDAGTSPSQQSLSNAVDIFDAATHTWSTASLSQPSIPATLVTGHLALFTGDTQLDVYHADSNTWTHATLPTAPLFAGYPGSAEYPIAAIGNQVFFGSGPYGHQTTVDTLNLLTGQWTTHQLTNPHDSHPVIDGKLVFAGGSSEDGGPQGSNLVETYDPATNAWSTTTLLNSADGYQPITVGNRVFMTNGEPIDASTGTGVEAFDAATGATAEVLLSPQRWAGATAAVDDQALFIGIVAYGPTADVDALISSPVAEPSAPSIVDHAALATAPATLSWSPDDGATSYDVYLDDQLVANVTSPAWSIDRALAAGAHGWQVVARGASSLTPGPRWSFTIGAPAAPANPNVPNGASLASPPLTLAWGPATSATSYDLMLDGARVGTTIVPFYTFNEPLIGGAHTWQVIAKNDLASTPGPVWSFATPATGLRHDHRTLSPSTGFGEDVVPLTIGNTALFATASRQDDGNLYLYDANFGHWSTQQLPDPRYNFAAAVLGTTAFFAGGDDGGYTVSFTDRVDLFNTATGQWSHARLSQRRENAVGASAGRVIAFAGGDARTRRGHATVTSDVVDLYNSRTKRWTSSHLSQARDVAAAAAVGTKLLFAGGSTQYGVSGESSASDAVDVYDAATGRWSITHLPHAAAALRAVTVGRRVYFIGSSSVDVYDDATGNWSSIPIPFQPLASRASAPVVVGTSIYFTGYVTRPSNVATDVAFILDTTNDTLSTATLSVSRAGTTVAAAGNRVIFAGGRLADGAATDVVDVYDTRTGAWSIDHASVAGGYGDAASLGNTALVVQFADPSQVQADRFVDSAAAAPHLTATGVFGITPVNGPDRPTSAFVNLVNDGNAPLAGPAHVNLYAAPGTTLHHATLVGVATLTGPLRAGGLAQVSAALHFPAALPAGTYHLIAASDVLDPVVATVPFHYTPPAPAPVKPSKPPLFQRHV